MYQRIELIGHLGKDPDMRFTEAGQPVTKLSVATNRSWKDSAGDQKETTWFRVTVWGRQAEACNEHLHKGAMVFVEGRLSPDRNTGGPKMWKDAEGFMRSSFEVTASQVKFLTPKGGAVTVTGESGDPVYENTDQDPGQDEIPF